MRDQRDSPDVYDLAHQTATLLCLACAASSNSRYHGHRLVDVFYLNNNALGAVDSSGAVVSDNGLTTA
jgi:hypothetical protein